MTLAICLNCGARRVGAITDCSECGVASTGHFELDVTFSDHRMSLENLEHFGEVIRTIARTGAEDGVRHWAFLLQVGEHYPYLLTVDPPTEEREAAAALLDGLSFPKIDLELRSVGGGGVIGPSSWRGLVAMWAVGSLLVLVGFNIETYDLPWYRDVRSILVVGLGAMIIAGATQSLWELAREKRGAGLPSDAPSTLASDGDRP